MSLVSVTHVASLMSSVYVVSVVSQVSVCVSGVRCACSVPDVPGVCSHSSHIDRRPHRRSSSGHRSYRSNRHHRHSDSQLPSPNGMPLSRSLRRTIRRGDCIVGGYIGGRWGAPYLSFMAQTTSANLFIRILASGLVNLCRGTISSKTSPSLPLF